MFKLALATALLLWSSVCLAQVPAPGTQPSDAAGATVSNGSSARAALEEQASSNAARRKRGLANFGPALAEDLEGGDAMRQKEAIAILLDPKLVHPSLMHNLPEHWLEPLLSLKQYDLILNLCDRGLQGDLSDSKLLSEMIFCEAKTLLATEKYDDAMSAAKSYFNVCKLQETPDAIRLVSEVLLNSRAKAEPDIVQRFKRQQEALAQPPAAVDGPPVSLPTELGDNILASIQVDSKQYDELLKRASTGPISFKSLTAQGNILLAADRPQEAQKAFQTASDLATSKQLSDAISNIARSIRAEDSSVGRANAYILSLRKTKSGTATTGKSK